MLSPKTHSRSGLAGAAARQRAGGAPACARVHEACSCPLAISCFSAFFIRLKQLLQFELKPLLQFEFKWPLDAPPADFDRVDAIAQRLRGTAGPA